MQNDEQFPALPQLTRQQPLEQVTLRLKKRRRADICFKYFGLLTIIATLSFIIFLFVRIFLAGYSAFIETRIQLDITFYEKIFRNENLGIAPYQELANTALAQLFPLISEPQDKKQLEELLSSGAAYILREMVESNPRIIGSKQQVWVPADDLVDLWVKGTTKHNMSQESRLLSDKQLGFIDELQKRGRLSTHFNTTFFTAGDSREPELAGIRGAVKGTILTLTFTLLFAFVIGNGTAIYLEEFSHDSAWKDLITINVNNLAAIPSIIFGLLGLAALINFCGLPRSTPLVGGLVLGLMVLPTIIISGRASLQAVSPAIREAAMALGASRIQTIMHHVLPLAFPGMLTGGVIGIARALGETAPLLMVGMVAFIADVPQSFTDPATVLPVQIYLWSDSAEPAFIEKSAAAILVLLLFLVIMNGCAVLLRRKFEIKW